MLRVAVVVLCVISAAGAAEKSKSKKTRDEKRITIDELVTAAPLPKDYEITRQEVEIKGKLLGHKLLLTKEDAVSKAIVTVENRKVSTRDEKVAATKAYVNGASRLFSEAGLKLAKKEIPDLDQADFDEPIVVSLVYEKPDGEQLLVQVRTFFTDTGHSVLVVADDEDEYKMLTKWAKSVEGKKRDEKQATPLTGF